MSKPLEAYHLRGLLNISSERVETMKDTDTELTRLADRYLEALAGGEVRSALRYHASKAGINLKHVSLDGIEHQVVYNAFVAARAQEKLEKLLDAIREDGFELRVTSDGDLETDFDDSRYREWLRAETEYVDIRGIGERKAEEAIVFPILELYTELYVQTGLTNVDLDQGRMRGKQRVSLSQMVDATRRLVVMGDPGSGKTTFLRFLARKQVVGTSKPLPFYLRLAEVYEFAMSSNLPIDPRVLIKFCVHLSEIENLHMTEFGLERRAQAGKCIWLLDSLDELPSTEARERIVFAVERASQRWDKCKFVLTSRPLPIRARAIPVGFDVVGIDYWTQEDIKSFLKAWTALLYVNATEEKRRSYWGNLLSTILERSDLRSLARNAVMVTSMAVVHYNQKRLPEGRADLIEALIYWLIRAKSRDSHSPYATPKFIEDRYRELALAMFESEEGRRRRVGRLWAAEKIARHFNGDVEAALEFLAREETETGVLVRRGEGDLEFWHLSFQEYLAAKEIAGKTDDIDKGWWARIQSHLDEPEWREVLAFVPACLSRLGSERVDLFFERLGDSCTDRDLSTKAKRVALGGSILRDLQLPGYKPEGVSAWTRALNDVLPLFSIEGEGIPLETRYEAAIAYGLGGDDRLRDFDKTWVQLPGGIFLMGAQAQDSSAPNFDPDAAPWEGPVCEILVAPFEIRKYPITIQEYAEFVSDQGYQTRIFWTDEAWDWLQKNGYAEPAEWTEQLLTPNCPITGVSWFEANAYCVWLTLQDLRRIEYRLPSEAEWEYAARHGLPPGQHFPWGNTVTPGQKVEANFAWSGLRKKAPVGMFPKCVTADGIFDMFGNVEEWCANRWTPDHTNYPNGEIGWRDRASNPRRVVRGGNTIRFSRLCRSTYRSRVGQEGRYRVLSFRPIRIRK